MAEKKYLRRQRHQTDDDPLRSKALRLRRRHADRTLQVADGAQVTVGRRGLGIDQAMQTEAVLQREQQSARPRLSP